jgi:hypothetical protein
MTIRQLYLTPITAAFVVLTATAAVMSADPSEPEIAAATAAISRLGGSVTPYIDPATLEEDRTAKTVRFLNSELTDEDLIKVRDALTTIDPKRLDLRFTQIRGRAKGRETWTQLHLPHLEDLDISSTFVDSNALPRIPDFLTPEDVRKRGIPLKYRLRLDYNMLVLDPLVGFLRDQPDVHLYLHLSHVHMRSSARGLQPIEANDWFTQLVGIAPPSLRGLDVSYTGLTKKGLQALSRRARLPALEELAISGAKDVATGDLRFLRDSPYLKTLDLSDLQLTDNALVELHGQHRLTSLSLGDNKITDDGLAALLKKTTPKLLRRLKLSGTSTLQSDEVCSLIGEFVHLRSLDISATGISDDGLKTIWGCLLYKESMVGKDWKEYVHRQLKDLPDRPPGLLKVYHPGHLVELLLSQTVVTDKGLFDTDDTSGAVVGVRFPWLEKLDSADTQVTPGGRSRWLAFRKNNYVPPAQTDEPPTVKPQGGPLRGRS